MTNIFIDISLVLALSAVVAAIFSWLRQPVIIAYLLVGILAASSGLFSDITQGDTLEFFAELGIAFVLFLIGLELKFSDVKQIGRAALFVGLGQIILVSVLGFLVGKSILNLETTESLYLSLALTFSSTIIVVKLLGEKRDLDSLYGKIAIGYLIVQDLAAIAALIFLTSIGSGQEGSGFFITLVKGAFLVGLILVLNKYVLQNLFDMLAKNTEVLFLASISWALIFATLSASLGFSIEIGAFVAGLGLASLREEMQIASWIRPLRNLFVILFFLSLGLKLSLATLSSLLVPIALLTVFVLLVNPLVMMTIMGFLGFRSRTGFQVGVTSAQVSEFSLILVFLGNRLDFINDRIVNLTAGTALTTIVLSTYLIINSSKIYKLLGPYLRIFQRKTLTEKLFRQEEELSDHVVLVGAGRLGWGLFERLEKKGESVLVVDFNPQIIKKLEAGNHPFIYGDVSDPEIFTLATGKNSKMIISTIFEVEATRTLLEEAKKLPHKIPVIVTSDTVQNALEYYKAGASYVIVPRILSGGLIQKFLISTKPEDLKEGALRREHIEELSKRLAS
jgi:Kef-type K+ transport system membrane component KefB